MDEQAYRREERIGQQKILWGFGLVIVILAANAFASYRTVRTLIENNGLVLHTNDVITELEGTLSLLKDAETGQRGYIITGAERYLEPYRTATPVIGEQLRQLRELTHDSAGQQERVRRLEALAKERLSLLQEVIDARRNRGFEAASDIILSDRGKAVMDSIRALVAEAKAEESRLLQARTAQSERSGRNALLTFMVANLLALVLVSLVYYVSKRDLLARQQAQTALRAARDQLEQRVRERTAELIRTNQELGEEITERQRAEEKLQRFTKELERSNRELQDFAFVASHDLQEPLRKIQAFGDLLKSQYGAVLGEEGQDFVGRMQNASRRMHVLINDLLTFSRVTTKAQPFAPVDLSEVTREVLGDLEVRIRQTGGRVEVGALPTLDADPLQMRQLLQNLIGNALKFHRPGVPPVVRLSAVPLSNGRGTEATNGRGEKYLIEVADNGIGFDEKYLDRIFTPFQRLHSRGEYEGTGMGLAVCRKIVERHDGQLTATSTPGAGTKFSVTLPAEHPNKSEGEANL